MAKNSKKNYKRFPLDSIEEGLQALGSLISNVIHNLKKYNEYSTEIEGLYDKYSSLQKNSVEEVNIPAKEYDDINDKLLYRQRELLKFIADYQESSFSYMNLRKYLVKRKYIDRSLNSQAEQTLKELLDIRNWTFHNPQSMLVAAKESVTKRLPGELVDLVKIQPQLNPVIIDSITHYDINMVVSLMIHNSIRIKQFELILENMKTDYSEMYEKVSYKGFLFKDGLFTKDVVYQEIPRVSRLYTTANDMALISMAIQKSKYDGSDESFEKWVIQKSSLSKDE